jgi:hypothetical protein
MGRLLYSLPLAPGQKKQIAVLDWERRESAIRQEALEEVESLQATLSRDRDIGEMVRAKARAAALRPIPARLAVGWASARLYPPWAV